MIKTSTKDQIKALKKEIRELREARQILEEDDSDRIARFMELEAMEEEDNDYRRDPGNQPENIR